MSLFPLLFSNWWEELDRPHHVRDQHFGVGLHPDHLTVMPTDIFEPRPPKPLLSHGIPHHGFSSHGHYYRPWGELLRSRHANEGGVSTLKAEKDKFQVVLDVQQFAPEEINVKVVDKHIIVEGNHEEKQDEHGWISRKFSRRYLIPEQCDNEKVESKLSSDGVLTIVVPRKVQPQIEGERVIPIQHTGVPAVKAATEEKKVESK